MEHVNDFLISLIRAAYIQFAFETGHVARLSKGGVA